MRISFVLFLLLIFTSCNKKKEVLKTGTFKDANGISLAYEIYTERDSFFRTISNPASGMLYSIQQAATQKEIEDSSFAETVYSETGKIVQTKSFLNAKPAGEWTVWNESGIKTSFTRIEHGRAIAYQSWYDDGTLRVEGKKEGKDSMARREFFSNGNPDREFWIDSLGNGRCIIYFPNGKIREKGTLSHYGPTGTWNRFDSVGNVKTDTVY